MQYHVPCQANAAQIYLFLQGRGAGGGSRPRRTRTAAPPQVEHVTEVVRGF
jgi:hypothetical protein